MSKRSVWNYENGFEIPRTVALACHAIETERRTIDFEELVRAQHPRLGGCLIVVPFVVERGSGYAELLRVALTPDAAEWFDDAARKNTRFSMRTVMLDTGERRQVAVFAFETDEDRVAFEMRWR